MLQKIFFRRFILLTIALSLTANLRASQNEDESNTLNKLVPAHGAVSFGEELSKEIISIIINFSENRENIKCVSKLFYSIANENINFLRIRNFDNRKINLSDFNWQFPNLRALKIQKGTILNDDARALAQLSSLISLNLSGCNTTSVGKHNWKEFCDKEEYNKVIEIILTNTALKNLNLKNYGGKSFTTELSEHELKALSDNTSLTTLSLSKPYLRMEKKNNS